MACSASAPSARAATALLLLASIVASCLQAFLRELLKSLTCPDITRLLCSPEGRERLDISGNASFALYYFLSSVAMEHDMRSNTTVMLLERLNEFAEQPWQKQLALHQLGCVILQRGEFEEPQEWFEAAVAEGHVYSLAGEARAKYKRGHKYAAYKLMNSVVGDYEEPTGWMYQERSLYCVGKEKLADLQAMTELDLTLTFPYKYRACLLLEEDNAESAVAEISKVVGGGDTRGIGTRVVDEGVTAFARFGFWGLICKSRD